jgi:hypothetical protein
MSRRLEYMLLALLAIIIAGASTAHCQTTVTVTGTIRDIAGNVVTSGNIEFWPRPGGDATISGYSRYAMGAKSTCGITGAGLIKANDLIAACTVVKNTALTPAGSYYFVRMCPSFVCTGEFNWYAITDPTDLTTVVPTPGTSPAESFVNVVSNQTIGGNKTFTGITTFNASVVFANSTPFTVSGTGVVANLTVEHLDPTFDVRTANLYSVSVTNPAAPRTITWPDPGANDDILYRLATQTVKGKTIDCTGGANDNTCTTEIIAVYQLGDCQNATATSFLSLPVANPVVAACITGANVQQGSSDAADGANSLSGQGHFLLPANWNGTLNARVVAQYTGTTGVVKWQLATACVAVDGSESNDPAFNTASTATQTVPGTANRPQATDIAAVTVTGCAAREIMHWKLFRDPTDAADTSASTAKALFVEFSWTRSY